MQLRSPQIVTGAFAEAHQQALDAGEPVLMPLSIYADERGWSLMNLLRGVLGPQGQVNFSTMYPGVVKAWHRHHKQTDFWFCLRGDVKAGVWRERDGQAWLAFLGEHRPGLLIVPPTLWHGLTTVGDTPAGLLYYVTHAYDPQAPDEERRPFDSVPGFPWAVRHG